MPQALITVNGVPGSNTALPINTLVQLNNSNTGGETTFLWTILDQPDGAVDSLSNTAIQNPTFTPRKEGTYLIELVVNAGPLELRDRVVCGIRYLKSYRRAPAAGEVDESDATDGWKVEMTAQLTMLTDIKADPGISTGNLASGALVLYDVVKPTGVQVIKTGLPGQETITTWGAALANVADIVYMPLAILLTTVDGTAIAINKLAFFRNFGLAQGVSIVGATLGDIVYVSDTGKLARVAGSNSRRVGRIINVPSADIADVWFNGLGGD